MTGDDDADALHANYWLSGVAGHRLKHELDLPLVSTFHTLARVKAETGDPEPQRRVDAEAEVIGCSDAILANCPAEAAQLVRLYGADPDRVEIVPPGRRPRLLLAGRPGRGPAALAAPRPVPGAGAAVRRPDPAAQGPRRRRPGAGRARRPRRRAGGGRRRQRRRRPAESSGSRSWPPRWAWPSGCGSPTRSPTTCCRPSTGRPTSCWSPAAASRSAWWPWRPAACGTPVVAAAVGGLRTLVDHGRTGFLVEGRDPATTPPTPSGSSTTRAGRDLSAQAALRARGLHLVDGGRPPPPDLRRHHRPRPGHLPD